MLESDFNRGHRRGKSLGHYPGGSCFSCTWTWALSPHIPDTYDTSLDFYSALFKVLDASDLSASGHIFSKPKQNLTSSSKSKSSTQLELKSRQREAG